jgi:hypothetical protein
MILGIFLLKSFYLDYNSIGQKTLFRISPFQIASRTQKDLRFIYASFYQNTRPVELGPQLEGQEGQKRIVALPGTLGPWPRHPCSFRPQGSNVVDVHLYELVLT